MVSVTCIVKRHVLEIELMSFSETFGIAYLVKSNLDLIVTKGTNETCFRTSVAIQSITKSHGSC